MRFRISSRCLYLLLAVLLVIAGMATGAAPALALTGSATASAVPSNSTPSVGDQITVAVNIDVSGVDSPDNVLGSYTATLSWDSTKLEYVSYSGAPPSGFSGLVNESNAATGQLTFNGANASGATGQISILTATFNVLGIGTSTVDLAFSAMSSPSPGYANLLSVLTINDAQVEATADDPGDPVEYLGEVGSVTANSAGTTLAIPVGSSGVAAGNTIIVGFASRGASTYNEPTLADSAGNTYQLATFAVTYQHGRAYVFYAHVTNPLVSGNSITITSSSVASRVAVAAAFSGLLETSPLDQVVANPTGTSTTQQGNSPTAGPTGTTAQANELLIGVIGTEEATDAGIGTWLNDFTAGPQVKTSGATNEWRVSMGYRMVSAIGTYTAAKTVTNNPYWAANIATFKAASTTPPQEYTIAATAGANGSISPSGAVTVTEGQSQSFTITPATGYQVADVLVDGSSVGAVGSYDFTNVQANHTIAASFSEIPPNPITYLGQVGSVTANSAGTTLSIPVGSGGVAAGNTIIVGFASRGASTYNEPTLTDTAGNTYSLATFAVTYQHGRAYVFYAHVTNPLVSGNSITITSSSVESRVAVAAVFSGLLESSLLDQVVANPTGTSTTQQGDSPTAGPTGTTVQTNELLIGVIGTEEASDAGVGTWLNDFTAGPQVKTSGASYEWRVSMGYRIVSAIGTYTAAKTVTNNPYWAANIATFKAGAPATTHSLTVTVDPSGGGTTTPTEGVHTYVEGASVNVSATANTGYVFDHWSGACSGSGTCSVTMNTDKSVTAHFSTAVYHNLTLGVTPSGGGTTNPAVGAHSYVSGTVVDISATPSSGYVFDYWDGDVANANAASTTVTVNADKSVTAHFAESTVAIVDGAVSSGTADGVSSISVSHTTGTGANRLVLVGVSANSYNAARTISSVTFTPSGGSAIALTEVGSIENEAGRLAAIYSLVNPPSGASGTVLVTFSGSVANGIVAGVANFAGVDQSDPFDDFVSAVGTETTAISVNVPTDANDLVFDTIFLGAATLPTLAVGDGQTQQWNASVDRARGAASTEPATSTTTPMSWTASGGATSYYWAVGAVPINPAALQPHIT